MGKKTSKHIKAAAVNAERHNRREKHLEHPRPELQPEDRTKWIWEVEDKKSVYQMQKQAEREYAAKERTVKGKYGEYKMHKTLPKNAEPVKEAVVVIKEDTTIEQVKAWADWCHQSYGIRPVGIYIHMDEGHWAELDEKQGQCEEMYERNDGKEWKRLNAFGNYEYWKPNYHAHVLFDWFDHDEARCINLDRKVMRTMEDELAKALDMERGTPSKRKYLDSDTYKMVMESQRISLELANSVKKVKSLQTMIDNLTRERKSIEADLIEGYTEKNKKDKELSEIDEKIAGKQSKLDHATEELNGKLAEMNELQSDLEKVENRWFGEYRLNAEQKKTIRQLQETDRQLRATIEHLKPIAERVPGLESRIRELEAALEERTAEAMVSEERGIKEGKRRFVRDMYTAAGMKQPQMEPTAESVGQRYRKYWEASQKLGSTKEKLSQTERSLEEEKVWHAIDREEKEKALRVMGTMWNGMWEAIKTLCERDDNRDWLTGAEKDIIRKPLSTGKTAKERIGCGMDLISFASAYRPLSLSMKGEVLQLAAEDGVVQLGKQGVGIADCANDVAAAAVCLFFGYMDAATTIMDSSGGGGSSPESGWGRKKDEDSLTFGKRCLLMARNMLEPDDGEEPRQERKRGYRR
ncbi:MAG: hypothetical protein J5797_08495 [Prevotella sp.]|nr:hypothetical protein [Prevotella sp.]